MTRSGESGSRRASGREAAAHGAAFRSGTVAVVLNYRTPEDTILAVRSLQASRTPPAAIIVVDNASGDGSPERLRDSLSDVTLIVAAANDGFSAGCNLGIRTALAVGARRVLLLNSDVIVPPDTLGALEQALDGEPDLGIVAPVLVSRANPDEVQSVGIAYSRATGRMRHQGCGQRQAGLEPFDRKNVDGVSGCAMLIKREVLERAGLLAEEFFFGFEDLDLCLRARRAGFRTACIGTVSVLHEGSLSIGRQSRLRIYFATRNHLLLAARVSGTQPAALRWMRAGAIAGLNLAHVLFTSDVPLREGLRGFVWGLSDYLKGRSGPPGGTTGTSRETSAGSAPGSRRRSRKTVV